MLDNDELDDSTEYCIYCYEKKYRSGCCGENHFMTGKEIKEHDKELDEIDKSMKGANT